MAIEYPYIPTERTIKYVPISNSYMKEAQKVRDDFSTDLFHKTGAVIVKNNKIIGRGANQAGIKNKSFQNLHKKGLCLRRVFKIASGQKYWLCPGCSSYADHAEAQAIKDVHKNNEDTKDADLYLYGHWWCCKPCWDKMISAGIKDVYLVDNATELFM